MKIFPFNNEDLLTYNHFINYCRDKGVNVTKSLLKKLHKNNILIPVLRIDLGYRVFIKDSNNNYIEQYSDIKKNNKLYYKNGIIDYSGNTWLKFYEDNNLVEYPIHDKIFIEWDKYIYPTFEYHSSLETLPIHKILFYTKDQIHLLKIILNVFPISMQYTAPIEHVDFQWMQDIINHKISTTINFLKNERIKLIHFIKELNNVKDILYKDNIKLNKYINKTIIKNLKGDDQSEKNKKEERKHIIKRLQNDHVTYIKSKILNFNILKDIHTFFIHQGFDNYYTYEIFKTMTSKSKGYYTHGPTQYTIECYKYIKLIETIFNRINYKDWDNIETQLIISEKFDGFCTMCGQGFKNNSNNQITCSEQCSNDQKNLRKRENRKKNK